MGKEADRHLKRMGVERSFTTHDMPEHNGISECKNHTLLNLVQVMLEDSQLPRGMWGNALLYAVWLMNRIPTTVLNNRVEGNSPYEVLCDKVPDLLCVQRFGCHMIVRQEAKTDKLDP